MGKQAMTQLELFSQGNDSRPGRSAEETSFIQRWLKKFEGLILVFIAFVAAVIISFSLGVEQGKRIALRLNRARFDLAFQKQKVNTVPLAVFSSPRRPLAPVVAPVIKTQPVSRAVTPVQKSLAAGGFTVQVASYRNKSQAEKETAALRKKGLSAMTLKLGKYTVVCVGNFNNKKNAAQVVVQLKKQYRDCFIRRL